MAATTFTIRELTGDRRHLDLRERALPYRPLTFTGEMRAEFTAYPGNPVRTVQLLGATESDTTAKGYWKDRFVAQGFPGSLLAPAVLDGEAVVDVRTLVDLVDDFRVKGQLLEVSWDLSIRYGVITKFVQTWHNEHDCEWELTFGWTSREEPVSATTVPVVNPADFASQWQAAQEQLSETARPDFAMGADFAATLEAGANAAVVSMGAAVDAAQQAIDTASTPIRVAQTLIAAGENIKRTALGLWTGLQGYQLASLVADVTGEGSLFAAAKLRRDVQRLERDSAAQAELYDRQQARNVDPELVATFIAREDMDLRMVAVQFYGRQDGWRDLMTFNALTESGLHAGQVVFVPARAASAGGGANG